MDTKTKIIDTVKHLFATNGYKGVSMRNIAVSTGITLSNIYHYFPSKERLLEDAFNITNTQLGDRRRQLPITNSASDMLRQIIKFQFINAEEVVYVLKYYLTFRNKFKKQKGGFLPPKTYLHIEEVLLRGSESGEFRINNLYEDAQVIAHSINGFILEYYPHKLSKQESEIIVNKIHDLLIRALTNHEK